MPSPGAHPPAAADRAPGRSPPHPAVAAAVRDPARLAALARTGLLDARIGAPLDRLTRLATDLLGVPLALVTLVDADRQVFASVAGAFPAPWQSARETPLSHSFCQHVVGRSAPLVVRDARRDRMLCDNAAISDLRVIAYAGVPIVGADGAALGSFCAIDARPRAWTPAELEALEALCEIAVAELERYGTLAALREREALLAQFVEHAPAAVAMFDRELRCLVASRRWHAAFGLAGAAAGVALAELVPDLPAAWHADHARVLAGEVLRRDDDVLVRADGREEHLRRELHPWRTADGAVGGVLMFIEVVTDRVRLERALAHQALHDALTGLANRTLFHDRLAHALARRARAPGEHVAVLLLDLDDFKTVNDTLGHAAGDRLLVEASERLRRATRGFDTVARLGGDEFAVLLEGLAAPRDAEAVAGRVLQAFGLPFPLGETSARVSASVGLAHAEDPRPPGEGEPLADADALLRNADVAMYRAKSTGKMRHAVYEPTMHAALRARAALETALRAAVADPAAHGLSLAYQPVVELATGRVRAVEALLRWHVPRRGALAPTQFIPLAEETGLIAPLGRWVLDVACRQLAAWERAFGPEAAPAMAVNLSGRQLDDPDVVREVALVIAAHGVAPGRLTLEITETALARDPDAARDTLLALKALGVQIAVDDFGTGYSNLGYLQQFPVDVLKIDKRFVDGVARGGADAALARTIVALGDALGLRTVAEGVECPEQRDELLEIGCVLGQGFLFARPLPAAALEAWLRGAAREAGAREADARDAD